MGTHRYVSVSKRDYFVEHVKNGIRGINETSWISLGSYEVKVVLFLIIQTTSTATR